MIRLIIPPVAKDLMTSLGISEEEAWTTLNDCDRSLTDAGFSRIAAVRWFGPERIVFLDGPISKRSAGKVKGRPVMFFEEMTAGLVIEIQTKLPVGRIDRSMEMEQILRYVAMSFGVDLSAHPSELPSKFYAGRWDGKQISVSEREERHTYAICGSLNAAQKTAEMLYALDIDKYLDWFNSRVASCFLK